MIMVLYTVVPYNGGHLWSCKGLSSACEKGIVEIFSIETVVDSNLKSIYKHPEDWATDKAREHVKGSGMCIHVMAI